MKTTILTAAALLLAGSLALAQNAKVQNDHTYSTHNYKHANKAAEARRWEQKGTTTVTPPAALPAVANYKRSVPGQQPAGGVTISTNGPASVASRNYKAGNSQTQSSADTRSANKKRNRAGADKSAIGND